MKKICSLWLRIMRKEKDEDGWWKYAPSLNTSAMEELFLFGVSCAALTLDERVKRLRELKSDVGVEHIICEFYILRKKVGRLSAGGKENAFLLICLSKEKLG